MSDLIDAFQRHSRRQSSIPDKRNYVEVFVLEIARSRDAQRRGNRRSGVSCVEHVVFRFLAAKETAQPVVLANGGELLAAAREDLMRIGLMTYVDDQFVLRRV